MDVAPVTAFQSGTNRWQRLSRWPAAPASAGGSISSRAWRSASSPRAGAAQTAIMCPTRRIPSPTCRGRSRASSYEDDHWKAWLPTDQRNVSSRPDVLTFTGRVLTAPVTVAGTAGGPSERLDQRDRQRLGGQADRRLSRRSADRPRHGRLSARGRDGHLPRPLPRSRCRMPSRSRRTCRSLHASICRRPTTSSCPATGSWCRSSRAGSRSTTAIRRPSSPTSSSPSRRIMSWRSKRWWSAGPQESFIELPIAR